MTKDLVRDALVTLDLKAPGLTWITRGGKVIPYWIASKAARLGGFEPKTVQMHFDGTPIEVAREIAARCSKLHSEMLEWQAGAPEVRTAFAPGTIGWLGSNFQTDMDSPYRDKRQDTQIFMTTPSASCSAASEPL